MMAAEADKQLSLEPVTPKGEARDAEWCEENKVVIHEQECRHCGREHRWTTVLPIIEDRPSTVAEVKECPETGELMAQSRPDVDVTMGFQVVPNYAKGVEVVAEESGRQLVDEHGETIDELADHSHVFFSAEDAESFRQQMNAPDCWVIVETYRIGPSEAYIEAERS